MTVLNVTNGDSAVQALRAAGFEGEFLPWRDVLHDGPVPAGLAPEALAAERAAFIHEAGWSSPDAALRDFRTRDRMLGDSSVRRHVLWFEHDLYDQLQLIQILSRFRGESERAVELVCEDLYVAEQSSDALHALHARRVPVTADHVETAIDAWRAFRAPNPMGLVEASAEHLSPLPYLAPALRRLLEEYPHILTGLARSEAQILQTVAHWESTGDAPKASEIFLATQSLEEARYMGDASFWTRLAVLAGGDTPLLRLSTGTPARVPDRSTFATTVRLTEEGHSVLRGESDRVTLLGLDRWIGGVHLRVENQWRWDPETGRLEGAE